MPNPRWAAVPRARLPLFCLSIALGGAACGGSGLVQDPEGEAVLAQCSAPVEGSRYSLCGKLTTAGFGGPGEQQSLRGSVDAAPQPQGGRYSIRGGTFHVAR
jgi:hypothetical protein